LSKLCDSHQGLEPRLDTVALDPGKGKLRAAVEDRTGAWGPDPTEARRAAR